MQRTRELCLPIMSAADATAAAVAELLIKNVKTTVGQLTPVAVSIYAVVNGVGGGPSPGSRTFRKIACHNPFFLTYPVRIL